MEKVREFKKKSTFASLTTLKPLDCVDHNMGTILKETLLVSWETCLWVKKQQLELDMEQGTGSKLGKEYVKPILTLLI